jgi:hypothetical protein
VVTVKLRESLLLDGVSVAPGATLEVSATLAENLEREGVAFVVEDSARRQARVVSAPRNEALTT